MARRDALMRITKSLLTRRTELRKRLGMEFDTLGSKSPAATGDAADAAFEHAGEELAFQLAELEAQELAQVERALLRIKQGKYGVCDGCSTKIPVAAAQRPALQHPVHQVPAGGRVRHRVRRRVGGDGLGEGPRRATGRTTATSIWPTWRST